jgi:hypothetical protein
MMVALAQVQMMVALAQMTAARVRAARTQTDKKEKAHLTDAPFFFCRDYRRSGLLLRE